MNKEKKEGIREREREKTRAISMKIAVNGKAKTKVHVRFEGMNSICERSLG